MAVGGFSLYAGDGITPIPVPRPNVATFETKVLGQFADGTERVARYKRVVWKWRRMSKAQYEAIVAAKQPGRQTIETRKRATGGVAAQFVIATAIMQETVAATENERGDYGGVTATFIMVEEV